MIQLNRTHYIAALVVLALVVLFAAWSRNGSAPVDPAQSAAAESAQTASADAAPAESADPAAQAAAETEETPLVGVWIPYMSLSTTEKTETAFKENYDAKLESAKAAGANAVFVHVRPFADSLYPSEYEPWSHILTGTQGEDPGYDPLQYMVDRAHECGMQFHAWINPLRISTDATPGTLAEDSFYMQNRETNPFYFLEYDGGIYYNPASAVVRERIANGAAEIAALYDVDGIHFDDYFYPTDDESIDANQYAAYVEETEEPLPLHEWRTANINALIAAVYHRIKQTAPDVVFGISPQGNLDNNEKINADVLTWCAQSGYIDYICPQLYYSFENEALPFEEALQQWNAMERLDSVKLYIGLAVYKAGTDADNGTWLNTDDTIARQIERAEETGADGVILYAVDYLDREETRAEMANARAAIDAFGA